jgi:hypothetical protein
MPELQKEGGSLFLDCANDLLPCLYLLLRVDARGLRIPVIDINRTLTVLLCNGTARQDCKSCNSSTKICKAQVREIMNALL